MADYKLRPVTGRKRVSKNFAPSSHAAGFDAAIDDALKKTKWPKGVHPNIGVVFSVKVEVTNPGHIIEYAAKLVPGG
jgi:hypothetical protein